MKTLVIEIYKDAAQWKMSTFYKGESMAHRQYSIQKISEDNIKDLSLDVFNILGRTDHEGKVTASSLEELRKSAQLLYDQALSKEVKDEIRKTDATSLVFYIDEQLIPIPWELLHDGTNYLSLRFATGRVVLTSRKIHTESSRPIPSKLKVLAVCDPTGDLKKAYEEGVAIRNELDKSKNNIRMDLRTTDVDVKYLMKNIREYDVFHFAGHAKYDQKDSSKSGLILKGGDFTAEKLADLGGSSMPLLVFANACSSGETDERIEPAQENRIYGLADAFLLAGVKHYIGTLWKVEDRLSMNFAKIFYRNIRGDKSIGEALRQARLLLIERFGQTVIVWGSYVLYGDPEDRLIVSDNKEAAKRTRRRNITAAAILALIVSVIMLNSTRIKDEKPLKSLPFSQLENVFYVKQDGTIERHDIMNISDWNMAYGKNAYASSAESKDYAPAFAADNNLSTRWSSKFSNTQWIYVDLGETKPIGAIELLWEQAFACCYCVQISDNAKRWRTVWKTSQGAGEKEIIDLRGKGIFARYVKMLAKKRGTDWGYSLWEFKVCPDLLPGVSLNKMAFASSGIGKWSARYAVDGDLGTRWGSIYSDPQWIYTDLGATYSINMITVSWEKAYGSLYKIQRSDDGKSWTDVSEIQNDSDKPNNIYFEIPFLARYVRLYGISRATKWGYSIWEFDVRGAKESRDR